MTKPSNKPKAPLVDSLLVRVPRGMKATLRAAAKAKGLTVSALIRAAIMDATEKTKRKTKQ